MPYKTLYIFVEGDNDKKFFENVVIPTFEDKYDLVKPVKYAEERPKWVTRYLDSIEGMGAQYIFVSDINQAPCVTARKQEIQDKFRNIDKDRITVVIKEIESWYLAGLDDSSSKKLGTPCFDTTGSVTKEQFNGLIPKKFDSRIDFMQEILKCFDVETAKQKNTALNYFLKKQDCEV